MEVVNWPTEKPVPYARNSRKIPAEAVDKVAASIKEFGWRQPIVVDRDGVIVVGHTRLRAAQKLGMAEVPVHVATELTSAQIKAYRLMDNRSHEESGWDYDLLPVELSDLSDAGIDLALTGFDGSEIDKLLRPDEDVDTSPALGDVVFRVVVDCRSEQHQAELLEQFENEGLTCRPLMS